MIEARVWSFLHAIGWTKAASVMHSVVSQKEFVVATIKMKSLLKCCYHTHAANVTRRKHTEASAKTSWAIRSGQGQADFVMLYEFKFRHIYVVFCKHTTMRSYSTHCTVNNLIIKHVRWFTFDTHRCDIPDLLCVCIQGHNRKRHCHTVACG